MVFERFCNLNRCIFNKNESKWKVSYSHNASLVISNMTVNTKLNYFFVIADSTLKEYEIITLIYNRKTCKLDSLHFSVSEDVIIKAFQPCITKFGVRKCLNTNWSSWSADFFGPSFYDCQHLYFEGIWNNYVNIQ